MCLVWNNIQNLLYDNKLEETKMLKEKSVLNQSIACCSMPLRAISRKMIDVKVNGQQTKTEWGITFSFIFLYCVPHS